MIRRFATVAALAIGLLGCSTPYQEMGLTGGVSATQIDATTFRISGRGNGFTDPSTIQNYILLKAADVTLAAGYDVFVIGGEQDVTRTGSMSFGTANAYGNRNYASAYGTSTTMPVIKPGADIIIRVFKGPKPADAGPNVFDAHEIEKYLGPQVRR